MNIGDVQKQKDDLDSLIEIVSIWVTGGLTVLFLTWFVCTGSVWLLPLIIFFSIGLHYCCPSSYGAQWLQNPKYLECKELVNSTGHHVAMIEDFGYAAYPSALNSVTGNWERGGPYRDRLEAIAWAERVAGFRPTKPNDKRPPFYYKETT